MAPILRSVRILIEFDDVIRQVCKLAWSTNDASLYVFPYAPEGTFYFGQSSIPAGKTYARVPFEEQGSSDATPHLSIHRTGQVHVKVDNKIAAGPMKTPSLDGHVGNEAASIQITHFERLALFEGSPRRSGPDQDHLYRTTGQVESGRLALMINGAIPDFPHQPDLLITLERDVLSSPLYVGVLGLPMRLVDDDGSGGVLVSGGWDPTVEPDPSRDFDHLYIVAR